ncbi:MAG: saccharopine dehydrogenase family protein [Verrucomicrobiota bacterium]
MSRLLIIGAGGVGNVVARKCAGLRDVFPDICLASRTESKCKAIARQCDGEVATAKVDADRTGEVLSLFRDFRPDLVVNVALPYQDLPIMDACLEAGVHYLDTACYEPPEEARFSYEWQWSYHDRFADAGLMALLGCGFDPGAVSVFIAHVRKHHIEKIRTIDILDCNAGDHGRPFATNFNPEINIREVTQDGRYFEDGRWHTIPAFSNSVSYDFGEGIGEKRLYLIYHEELETLARNLDGIERMRFFMTFSDEYLTHLRVLEGVGMTSIEAIDYEGVEIVPLQFLKAVLPEPGHLGAETKGKTWIGCEVRGSTNGEERVRRVYNVCDHEACYREVGAQAISYTTGVPATVGAKLMATGVWKKPGVYNVEQFDPDPFLANMEELGLPWHEDEDVFVEQ